MYDRGRLAALSAVVEQGSFEAAAELLSITPSAVSQRIRALERQTRQVLVRRSRPCVPTDAGRTLLRLARQVTVLEGEVDRYLADDPDGAVHLPIAVNADSVTHWFLTAVVPLAEAHGVRLDLHVDDEEHTAALLREGSVVGAVTTSSVPVQGCTVRPLGATRYRPVAARAVYDRWFAGRDPAAAFPVAPRVDFGLKDRLQTRFVRQLTHRRCSGPAHRVPAADGVPRGRPGRARLGHVHRRPGPGRRRRRPVGAAEPRPLPGRTAVLAALDVADHRPRRAGRRGRDGGGRGTGAPAVTGRRVRSRTARADPAGCRR
ncbi:ArgP/LysG family DNA-binding transcriptional regulator [Pseudonocardia sp. HH130630-07]|uniref:ArgP/LysG family DNA-binding transcriptional regulator n=1 Tax=Pseudonocardia sp. HH130630-07 TaxID=1690815 RepID=UPI000815013C|nr:ArgP/LysG family DNA-binding transcriptional regulator [Pseudonocardia sp. HH130630-07]ANY09567.1 hypothetical protein AFB00_28735 [Pseudonocardia sp. HH130630-07]